MRTLLKVSMPVVPSNKAIADGSLPRAFQALREQLRTEAEYFYAENGKRTALFVFDMQDSAQIPAIAEPLFQKVEAGLELYPVMNAEELKRGLEQVGKGAARQPAVAAAGDGHKSRR